MTLKTTWKSPANIALIKYWGKRGDQLPANPSLSMSLSQSTTITTVTYQHAKQGTLVSCFKFHGETKTEFETKINAFLGRAKEFIPILASASLLIESENNFPHSSGISSSASFMSSLALCLCRLENLIEGKEFIDEAMLRKASFIARLGSGSASRSIYGKYSLWGAFSEMENSSNEYAIPLKQRISNCFQTYHDAILIVCSKPKAIPSSTGHQLMDGNPYAQIRYKTAGINLKNLLNVMETGNQADFTRIVENEALSLHALIMSSEPWQILMESSTIEIIRKIRKYRENNASNICFTLDAGPNIHLLYPENERDMILSFIKKELSDYCENGYWIDDKIGNGPQLLTKV